MYASRCAGAVSRRALLTGLASIVTASTFVAARRTFAADQKPILLSNVRIFNGRAKGLAQGSNVLVSGKRIEALVPASQTVNDAQTIDCGGRVLIPGLIDAHWHSIIAAIPEVVALTADLPYVHLVAAKEAERTLMRGFTTVRDVGGPSFSLKRAIDGGLFAGPRIFPSGAMISQTSGHGDFRMRHEIPRSTQTNPSHAEDAGISALADGVPEVLRRVREQLLLGASQIKIMVGGGVSSHYDPIDATQFTAEEIRAAVNAASDWGTYVCAHVYTPQGIHRAIDNGVQSIEHGQLADEDAVRKMADKGTWWSLQPFLADEDSNPKSLPEQQHQQKMIAEGTLRAFELVKKYKVRMGWGTDILFDPGKTGSQGKQLVKMARWFDTAEVLQMATSQNGELLGLSGRRNPYPGPLGVIEPGALADLLLIDGNPLENIALIAEPDKNMKLIMKDGRIYKNSLAV